MFIRFPLISRVNSNIMSDKFANQNHFPRQKATFFHKLMNIWTHHLIHPSRAIYPAIRNALASKLAPKVLPNWIKPPVVRNKERAANITSTDCIERRGCGQIDLIVFLSIPSARNNYFPDFQSSLPFATDGWELVFVCRVIFLSVACRWELSC